MSRALALCFVSTISLVFACSSGDSGASASKPQTIKIDGSSTVFPITEAVAEEFQKGKKVRVTIGVSGTGGGFKKFCRKETEVTGASRPIKPSEVELCKAAGVEYIELPVAYDGLAIVVNPANDWITDITPAELKTMWAPEAQKTILKWKQVNAAWPDSDLRLFGPGVDSGTYDYFTKAIVGKEHSSRGDFTSSEDDNVLVHGVSTDKGGLAFFGFAYYAENQDKLKLLSVNGVKPSLSTVKDGSYQPLSRPIFIYVRKDAASRPEVQDLIRFYLGTEGRKLVEETGYIGLGAAGYDLVLKRFESKTTGSIFEGKGSRVGVTVEDLLGDAG